MEERLYPLNAAGRNLDPQGLAQVREGGSISIWWTTWARPHAGRFAGLLGMGCLLGTRVFLVWLVARCDVCLRACTRVCVCVDRTRACSSTP